MTNRDQMKALANYFTAIKAADKSLNDSTIREVRIAREEYRSQYGVDPIFYR